MTFDLPDFSKITVSRDMFEQGPDIRATICAEMIRALKALEVIE